MTAPTALRPTADEMARATALVTDLGRVPTSNEVVKALGVGRVMANRIIIGLDHPATVHPDQSDRSTDTDQADHPVLPVVSDPTGLDSDRGTDVVDRADQAAPDHPDRDEQSTPVHPEPDGAEIPEPRSADRAVDGPSPLVTAGGPAVDREAVRPGPVPQSTPDQAAAGTGKDTSMDRMWSTYGPVAGPMDPQQSTRVAVGPVAGPTATADHAPEVDHSAERTGSGPVAPETDHPGPVERAIPTGFTRRVRRLEEHAAEARQLRALHVQPDIRAVVLMRQRRMWTLLAAVVLLITLASTAVNVQRFAAGTAPAWSTPWLAGWLVDPAFSLLLVGILIARGNLSTVRHKVTDAVVLIVEYGVLAAVLAMNVTPEIEAATVDPGQIALHAFLPLLAFGTASALTRIQDHYAAAIDDLYAGGDR